ncbi:MAG: ATP phosphoribosyltransferase regulatory subunit [Eubacteriales bacterium]|nr:ATP phosphoribosyltransferase regulatory subunit [Eubacteriales bacterium]
MIEFTVPAGMKDLIPEECRVKRMIERRLEDVMAARDYVEISSPTLEHYDTFSIGLNNRREEENYRLTDAGGKMLVLRQDMTVPIARIAATKFKHVTAPLRFRYTANVFRITRAFGGGQNEITHCGAELIGVPSHEGDMEILTMALEAMAFLRERRLKIEIGNIDIFNAACKEVSLRPETKHRLATLINGKNLDELAVFLERLDMPAKTRAFFNHLPLLCGGREVLETAGEYAFTDEMRAGLTYLAAIYDALVAAGHEETVALDLSKIPALDYYTGLIFEGFVENVGEPVVSGGRYDGLIGKFGTDRRAVGFSVKVDALVPLMLQPADPAGSEKLNIAMTKGRLEKQTVRILEEVGYGVGPLKNKGRQLVLSDTEKDIDYFLVKANDAITYVEHGVADIGIVGKDTIYESGNDFYEMMDLGIGKCKFILASLPGIDIFKKRGHVTIGTKYPQVAKNYFNGLGIDIEIIKIDGSVELGPILRLCDAVVDIMETGTTLRENGLIVLDEICDISARLIVNKASFRIKRREILAVMADIRAWRERNEIISG